MDSDPIRKARKFLAEGISAKLRILHIVLPSTDDDDMFDSSDELYYLQGLIPAAKSPVLSSALSR